MRRVVPLLARNPPQQCLGLLVGADAGIAENRLRSRVLIEGRPYYESQRHKHCERLSPSKAIAFGPLQTGLDAVVDVRLAQPLKAPRMEPLQVSLQGGAKFLALLLFKDAHLSVTNSQWPASH